VGFSLLGYQAPTMRNATSLLASLQAHTRWMTGRSANPSSGGFPVKIALRSRPAKCVRSAVPLVVAALLGSASAAGAGGFKISEKLTATAAAPRARGRAVVVVRGSDRKVRVAARGLQESTTHDVILDDVKIGTLTTSGRGNGRARFGSRLHTHDQFLGTDPRGKTIILRRADAAAVLVAHIPGSDDLIRCCLPGDEGTE